MITKYGTDVILFFWLANVCFQAWAIAVTAATDRMIVGGVFVVAIMALNWRGHFFFDLLLNAIQIYYRFRRMVRAVVRTKTDEKSKKTAHDPFRIRPRTILALTLILMSFSMEVIYTADSSAWIGSGIILIAFGYVVSTGFESWRTLRNISEITWQAEKFQRSIKQGEGLVSRLNASKYGPWVTGGFGVWKEVAPKLYGSVLTWVKEKLDALHLNVRFGLTLVRIYMFLQVLVSFLIITSVLVCLEGNYLHSVVQASGVKAEKAKLISDAFYLYTGNPISLPDAVLTPFLYSQMLTVSLLGWLVFAIIFALSIDIFSSAYEPVAKLSSEIVDQLRKHIDAAVKAIESSTVPTDLRPFVPVLVDCIAKLKEGTDKETLKSILEIVQKKLLEFSASDQKPTDITPT